MSLDPQIKALLAAMQSQPALDYSTLTAAELRQAFNNLGLPTEGRKSIKAVRDQVIDGPRGPIALRIYQPETLVALPVMVFFHGGGFVVGNLDSHDALCRALSDALPAVLVAVDYRLAPEYKFPAGIDDAFAATQWVAENAKALGSSADRVLVGGDSAGGNLAAVVCQLARDTGGPAIAHQLLIYPVCDNDLQRTSYQEVGKGYFLETELIAWFWQQYLTSPAEGELAKASPLRGNLAGLPSATVITAGFDPLHDEGDAYARLLKRAGVAVQHINAPGAIHGFMSFIGMLDVANQTLAEIAAAMNDALPAHHSAS